MIKGIIFDLDGTISDTQKLHAKVESDILARYGVEISPEEITKRYAGMNTRKIFEELISQQTTEYDLEKIMDEKWRRMEELASISVEPMEGAIPLIQKLHKEAFVLAVASASNVKYVENVLEKLNVRNHFSFLVGGDMVSKGKPDPESFLLAASKIGVEPTHCVVFEDGRSGMVAAGLAGMKCVGLVANKEQEHPTKNLVTSLCEVDVVELHSLL
jgi:HAD superfamily hydrolase (TIGR01509 family)